jgi:agmatinase
MRTSGNGSPDPMSDERQDYPPFLGSEIPPSPPEKGRFHVLPVPWERTVSYGGGTARGPAAILAASQQMEAWDRGEVPGSAGIYTHPPVDVAGGPEAVLCRIADAVAGILRIGAVPVVLGGEHTVTYGVVRGLLQAEIGDFGVVQLDAHADLRDSYEGDIFSHACAMRRVVEAGVPLFQLGVRAMCAEEAAARARYRVGYADAHDLVPGCVDRVELPADFPEQVFLTLDVDGPDPSVFPATGTPVPGGPGWYQTLSLLESVARQRRVIGFDLMELAPVAGFHCSDFAAAQLVYKLMGIQRHTRRSPLFPH